jgi:hypothetical protein
LFCIIYGFIGIPFTLLAIADLGKFFSEMIEAWEQRFQRLAKYFTNVLVVIKHM